MKRLLPTLGGDVCSDCWEHFSTCQELMNQYGVEFEPR